MATTYNLCAALIKKYKKAKDTAKLEALKDKMDVYLAANRLTDEEYTALMEMIG